MNLLNIIKEIVSNLKNEIPELDAPEVRFSLIKLPSKRNLVFSLNFDKKPKEYPQEFIVKVYQTDNADKEYKTLKKLEKQDILIPRIIFYKKPFLILEKIEGVNLCDFINEKLKNIDKLDDLDSYNRDRIIFGIKKLAIWMAQLHKQNILGTKIFSELIVLNKGNARLRDFMINISNDELYGFDFEESYEGNHIDDLAWICCALLDTNPGLFQMVQPQHKIELINIFLKEYYRNNNKSNFSFKYFAERLIDNLNIVLERRKLDISPVSKKNILKRILDDID